jgi:dTDP-4-amino-4,6-dideoxygalactose transaminase
VVEAKGTSSLVNMLGFNYRMTEIEAAIGREQLKKLPALIEQRIENVAYFSKILAGIPCLETAKVRENSKHVFYAHALKFDQQVAGIHRNRYVEAVRAELQPIELRETEGIQVGGGYVKPIYLQPMFQQKMAYGEHGCPWTCDKYSGSVSYSKGICPIVERMHYDVFIAHELIRPGMATSDLDDAANAFVKVWENRGELL